MINGVIRVSPKENNFVHVYFEDGRVKNFDASPLIARGGGWKRLEDKDFFKNRCVVLNGTLAWDVTGTYDKFKCLDVCPEMIYSESETVKHSDYY